MIITIIILAILLLTAVYAVHLSFKFIKQLEDQIDYYAEDIKKLEEKNREVKYQLLAQRQENTRLCGVIDKLKGVKKK